MQTTEVEEDVEPLLSPSALSSLRSDVEHPGQILQARFVMFHKGMNRN